ncbi:MAG: hypothetical protein RLY93_05310 [Sumerlaeia bacterium]
MARSEPTPERLMAWIDGELSEAEAAEFERLLEDHPEWREEAAELAAVAKAADQLAFKAPPAEVWDEYWEEIDERISRRTGWLLMCLGGLFLVIFCFVKIFLLAESPLIRSGLILMVAGFAILFLGVLRGHLLELPKDRYRRVKR